MQQKVLAEIAPGAADLTPDELREKVRTTVNEILEREDIGISPIERQRFVEEMLEDSLGYGPLEALLADGSISEIMCNAYDDIWIERRGKIEHSDIVFTSPEQYRRIIERMVAAVGRHVDESSPMVDARLADGSRINAIVPPLAVKAPILTIRKFPERPLRHAGPHRPGTVHHGRRRLPRGVRAGQDQHGGGRRNGHRKDHHAERPVQLHPARRAPHHH